MTAGHKPKDRIVASAMLVTVFVMMLLVHLVSPPASGLWMQTFADSVHVPIFGVIGLCMFVAAGTSPNTPLARRAGFAIGATCLLGAISEAAQIPGPRHASVDDLLADWLGAASFVMIATAVVAKRSDGAWLRGAYAATGLALLLVALDPLIRISAAYVERNGSVPTIVSFDSRFARRFVRPQHARLNLIQPAGFDRAIAEVTLLEGAWPGLIIHDIWPDWREHGTLVIELGTPDNRPLPLNIRVHDRRHRRGSQPHNDRYNLEYALQPGYHTLRVPLSDIRAAPAGRDMVMSEIDGIVLYCSSQQAGRRFRLVSIALE